MTGIVSTAVDLVMNTLCTLRVSKRSLTIEARLAALDAMALPHYEGIFESGKMCGQGSLVTRSGGLWLATANTDDTPGGATTARSTNAAGWTPHPPGGAAEVTLAVLYCIAVMHQRGSGPACSRSARAQGCRRLERGVRCALL